MLLLLSAVQINKGHTIYLFHTDSQKTEQVYTNTLRRLKKQTRDSSHLKFPPVFRTPTEAGHHHPPRLVILISWEASFHFDRNEVGKQSRSIGPNVWAHQVRSDNTSEHSRKPAETEQTGREEEETQEPRAGKAEREATETKHVHSIQCITSALQNGWPTSPRVEIIMAWQQQ